ncbi:hypothetical protein JCM19233_6559 [Vibrio astriarenae]|nr:hypothetical protein JCM19233_6559 [Vibrio sp. C7]
MELPAGSGPRHMVLNTEETRAWVVCELSETLVTLEYREGAWESIDQQPYYRDPNQKRRPQQ